MRWSYSRIKSFADCPYRFFLRYIKQSVDDDKFYASFGSFMHKIIDMYYKGELKTEEMPLYFLSHFSESVRGIRPSTDIVEHYISDGLQYLNTFQPLPYKKIETEAFMDFKFGDLPMVGVVDYIGEGDGLVIVDHKSRKLKPKSKRKKKTVNDETVDDMLRQLYMYAEAVRQKYGEYPTKLCFNCFLNGSFIVEDFDAKKLDEAKRWADEKVSEILKSDDFPPALSYFPCHYLCGVDHECCYKDMFFS